MSCDRMYHRDTSDTAPIAPFCRNCVPRKEVSEIESRKQNGNLFYSEAVLERDSLGLYCAASSLSYGDFTYAHKSHLKSYFQASQPIKDSYQRDAH